MFIVGETNTNFVNALATRRRVTEREETRLTLLVGVNVLQADRHFVTVRIADLHVERIRR